MHTPNKGDTIYLLRYGTYDVTVATFLCEEKVEDDQHDTTHTYYHTDKGEYMLGYGGYTACDSMQDVIDLIERTCLADAKKRLEQVKKRIKELKKLGPPSCSPASTNTPPRAIPLSSR